MTGYLRQADVLCIFICDSTKAPEDLAFCSSHLMQNTDRFFKAPKKPKRITAGAAICLQ